ncbi:PQQ-binding-like beta-propeller repeat protein [Tamlana sp. 2_MG-2023]|uniref:outer membrane protein assembly factor BamB family protein n=1 Tax=unclassified Tamlana TaxID=2614803 RepID=UPI0026E2C7F1|nr:MULTISPECIES: PQQ-binding-like beta-propeller repeat protein [unclassified Tamlana]MDO6760960.1 PQQ-binding-like beta-propeller repeat protein [Tamlana sp. 2_MG-2023]MDO6791216.1 PQQ-binding-like beta-propeller repeat protein [Tamlana sp. 1_MG-2023]
MRIFFKLFFSISFVFIITNSGFAQQKIDVKSELYSIDTKYTITKVRTGKTKKETILLASSYEGTVLGISFDGEILWKNPLSGFMNHDLWAGDINNDGVDEIFAANADGSVYCLSNKGKLLWQFKQNNAPMYSVTVIKKDHKAYVVCGGYDNSFYYVTSEGKLVSEVASKTYSIEKPFGKAKHKVLPPKGLHVTNFIRPAKKEGKDILVVHGVQNSMNGNGSVYFFNPLEMMPFETISVKKKGPYGDVRVVDADADGNSEVLLGRVGARAKGNGVIIIDTKTSEQSYLDINKVKDKSLNRGMYRVMQPEVIINNGKPAYMVLLGSNIVISDVDSNIADANVAPTRFSFNDMFKDPNSNKLILASAQSGGSSIHIIDFNKNSWKKEFEKLDPPGKIQTIIANTKEIRKNLKNFKKPTYQYESAKVYFMTESRKDKSAAAVINSIEARYDNPIFLNGGNFDKENWDRSAMPSEIYKNKRDGRMKYNLTQDEVLEIITKKHNQSYGKGISYWGGHGNDPYMYQVSTTMKGLDIANGKKTVLVYPEVEDHSDEFKFVMNDLILPLANYAKDKNGNLFMRNKHLFWQADVYTDKWEPLVSGRFANVFVPAMEETTDKSMELSFTSRLGLWASGSVDSWGARCARDNASFDRLRQHSNQTLPNHFLKTMVYSISSGAQYINNFSVDQDYMSLLWELIAEGVLYVPKRSDILSFSPVHLSVNNPDADYIQSSSNVKWLTFFKKDEDNLDELAFSRLNGTWPGAPLTAWDFSRYAAGAKERRLNFIPKYSNGMVLITPPQKGIFTDKNAVRKPLVDNIHPWYKNIMKEYHTDGKNYMSADGKETYKASEYYKVIEEDIKKSAALLPITVSGNVGWVVAQTSPTHLRLTVVENGYINPKEATAIVKVNNIKPLKISDLLNNEEFKVDEDSSFDIQIPLGGFRFIDIELKEKL